VDERGIVVKTLDRSKLWEVQTPQCFDFRLIYGLHKKARENNISVTDDCALAEIYNIDVKMVKGSYDNIKITVARDLFTAQEIIKTI
jgi:2-C-methyl-D-erythritol 4-phosphate cytidylyltransferase